MKLNQTLRHSARMQSGFTLIEMLVVVGIISVLIAMLMPTVQTARESAKRTQCASNLRQLGYAIQSYANDNRGWIPRDATLGHDDRPPWPLLLGRYLAPGRPLTMGRALFDLNNTTVEFFADADHCFFEGLVPAAPGVYRLRTGS